jgi:hypothetical protein
VTNEAKSVVAQMLLFDVTLVTYAICGRVKDVLSNLVRIQAMMLMFSNNNKKKTYFYFNFLRLMNYLFRWLFVEVEEEEQSKGK